MNGCAPSAITKTVRSALGMPSASGALAYRAGMTRQPPVALTGNDDVRELTMFSEVEAFVRQASFTTGVLLVRAQPITRRRLIPPGADVLCGARAEWNTRAAQAEARRHDLAVSTTTPTPRGGSLP